MQVKLVAYTQPIDASMTAEQLVAYCARVSNPDNQDNHDTAENLLRFCMDHKHWSIFQMVNAVVEIIAPRDIARQFTRHESMVVIESPDAVEVKYDGFDLKAGGVQEFSQRYSSKIDFISRELRRQDKKNRQNSINDLPAFTKLECQDQVGLVQRQSEIAYKVMLDRGVAKECARVVLPEGLTLSRMYVNGNLRSWLHYLQTRLSNGTQKEHRELAEMIKGELIEIFPVVLGMMD